jgi:hypothetical protein
MLCDSLQVIDAFLFQSLMRHFSSNLPPGLATYVGSIARRPFLGRDAHCSVRGCRRNRWWRRTTIRFDAHSANHVFLIKITTQRRRLLNIVTSPDVAHRAGAPIDDRAFINGNNNVVCTVVVEYSAAAAAAAAAGVVVAVPVVVNRFAT